MRWNVSVTCTSTASRDIEVEADTREQAEEKALELAGDTDFGGCVVEYEFDVAGSTPVKGAEEDDCEEDDDEPSPNIAYEENRCPDLGDETCALCPTVFPSDIHAAIDAGWFPSYFDGEDECSGPVCPNCVAQFIVCDPGGEATLSVNGEYVSVWDGGIDVRAKCVVNTQTRQIVIEHASSVEGLETMEREYVVLNSTEYEACNEEEWTTYSPEEQSRMFFWK